MSLVTGKDYVYGVNGNHNTYRMVSPKIDGSKLKLSFTNLALLKLLNRLVEV